MTWSHINQLNRAKTKNIKTASCIQAILARMLGIKQLQKKESPAKLTDPEGLRKCVVMVTPQKAVPTRMNRHHWWAR